MNAYLAYKSLSSRLDHYGCANETKPARALRHARIALRNAHHRAGDDEIAAVMTRTDKLREQYPLEALGLVL
jgi:hypothetical protein